MFANMKVGTKLGACFALILMFMIGVIVNGMMTMGSMTEALKRITEQDWVKLELANTVSSGARDNARRNMELFITVDAGQRANILQHIEANKKRISDALAQLDKRLYRPEGKAVLAKITEARAAYVASFTRAAKLLDDGKRDAAIGIMVSETLPTLDVFMGTVGDLAAFQKTLAEDGAKQAVAAAATASQFTIGLGIVATLLGATLALWITRSLLRQLGGEPDYAAAIARKVAEGDLTQHIDLRANDTSSLLAAMRNMVERLSLTIGQVRSAADNLSSAAEEVSATSQSLSQASSEQAASIEETSSSMEEMSASISQNTENAKVTNGIADKSAKEAAEGGEAVLATVDAMKSIAGKIGIIDDIAYQTNLLALNAAIEAARAGEHGKGFAVVAAEVRKLAERSQVAAQEIGELAGSSVKTSEKAGQLLQEMVPSIRKTAELVQEITAASEEQTSGAGQINTAMTQLSQTTQQNASASEQLSSTAEEMSGQAEQLQQIMSFFKVAQGNGAHDASIIPIVTARQPRVQAVAKRQPTGVRTAPSDAPVMQGEPEYVRF